MEAYPVVLFDGVCNLCSGSVRFIIQRDPRRLFRFASLQSAATQSLLANFPAAPAGMQTVLVIVGDRLLVRSDAALWIVRHLSGLWPLLSVLWVIPRPLRDAAYDWVARYRYRWFGKQDVCMIPAPQDRERFLE